MSWWSVREYVAPTLAAAVEWPMAGTPAWCDLDDTDPVKWAAICDAARHWALRVETCQAASAEASRDVSAAADWPAVSREIQRRRDAYIRRVVV
ncbi:phiRv2 prophage protein [Mycobacterium tuberculosis]|nr:phiRv2 prophage protein [Mycobacterium tuberculosis]